MGSAHRAAMGGARAPRRPTRGLRPRPPAPAPSPVAKGAAAGVAGGLGSEGGVLGSPGSATVTNCSFIQFKEIRAVEKMRKSAYGWNLGENEKKCIVFWTNQSTPLLSIVACLRYGMEKAKINYFHSISKI